MPPKFNGVDFYDIDRLLSEEERAVRDTVRGWVDDNLMPVIGEAYVAGKFPSNSSPAWPSSACSARICLKNTAAPG